MAWTSFNTASGKYYCNLKLDNREVIDVDVSIPQAVSTIAIGKEAALAALQVVSIPQAVSTIAICTLCSRI